MATIPLVQLVDSLLQKAYHDLTVLQELLRNKSDGDRKMEIVKYAQRTRALLIRLLALVKWAGNSSSVQKCSEMSIMLSQQSGLYVDTADQLVRLIRQTLVNACTPNFSLAPALDVLSMGTYPRLPTCIKERILTLPPLEGEKEEEAHQLINCAIRHRLANQHIPENMTVISISDGMLKFRVPYEFEISLSVVSGELDTPWRLISLKILVGEALPDKPVLIHEHQKLYLHQLVQSRLYAEDNPLQDCYKCLHTFCLSLCLDCLYSQANQLSHDVYGSYMKVEEYMFGRHLKIVYWRPGSSQFMSDFLLDKSRTSSWPKILISIDPSQPLHLYSTHHHPPLPPGSEVNVKPNNLSLESLLKECVRVRSHTLLKDIRAVLEGTIWNNQAELLELPLCLRIKIPLKYGSRLLVLGVDPRVGNIVASVEPVCPVGGVSSCLEELEKVVTSTWSTLPAQLAKLQCQLFVGHVSEIAESLHLPLHWSLPLVHPLPFHTSVLVYLELQPLTYLVVSVLEGLLDQYHLLSLSPASYGPISSHTPDAPPTPKSFFAISSLVELDPDEISLQHLRTVMVVKSGALLKRKLKESDLELPGLKRVCLRPTPNFAPLPGLITARMILLSMETSLNEVGISHHATYTDCGSPCANIFSFPQFDEKSRDMHLVLSSSLRSCQVTPTPSGYSSTFVFSPLNLGGRGNDHGDDIILRQVMSSELNGSSKNDLGPTLLGQWKARVCLLGLTFELYQYLDSVHWPLHSQCDVSEFTYDQLSVTCGRHSFSIKATPTGLSLSLPPDCPHSLVQTSLEKFLQDTQSLPLLLQGMAATESVMAVLVEFVGRIPAVTVTSSLPSQIILTYEHLLLLSSLTLNLQANSSVSFTDIRYSKTGAPLVPLSYLQAFLYHSLSSPSAELDDSGNGEDSTSLPSSSSTTSHRQALFSTPSPISYPRKISWPDSVPSPRGFNIPSIPSFPSPAIGSGMGQGGGSWNFPLSLDQFRQLLSVTPSQPVKPDTCVDGCSLLESFLGSLSLLSHAIFLANKPFLTFVQCDHGLYTYRTDNLTIMFAMEGGMLKTTLKQFRDNVWSNPELEVLMKFFKREVMCSPFSINAIQSFIILLTIPLPVLKNCVLMIQQQQNPPASGLVWSYSLCLCIPHGADLVGIPFNRGGPAVHYGRGKLLLFLKFEKVGDNKASFILPLMFDPKTNITYVARFPNQYRHALHPHIDSILRKASVEFASQLSGQPVSTLYHAIHTLAQTQLPV